MCILIPKFSLSVVRLIRAQADDEHPHRQERQGDYMEMTCPPLPHPSPPHTHHYSKGTVTSHFLEMNKGKERFVEDEASIQMKQSEN